MSRRALHTAAVGLALLAGLVCAEGLTFGPSVAHQSKKTAPFTPASLPSIVAWWDASTFTTDGSTKDGSNNVTRWEDKIGSYDLTVVAGTPLWTSAAVNGLDAIDFENGDNDGLAVNTAGPATPFEVYAVVRMESGANNRTVFYAGDKDSDNLHFHALAINTTPVATAATFDGASNGTASHGTTLSTATTYLLKGRWTSATSRGVNVDSLTEATNSGNRTPTGPDRVALGARYDATPGTLTWDGFICEVVLCNAILSSDQETALKSYLDAKWSIPGL